MTTLVIWRRILGAERTGTLPDNEKYPVALMAEAHVRKHLSDGYDFNKLWPVAMAEEVTSDLDPVHAFMVGVMCGASHG